jgi:nicotinate-nucleotide adenylyltransferase
MTKQGPLGLFGGRFDPIHRAHISIATAAANKLNLTEVRWIVSGDPEHKAVHATAEHRLEMVRLALLESQDVRMTIDDREIRAAQRGESNFTADTIAGIQREFPGRPLIWILGADQLEGFQTWSRWRWLINQMTLAVCLRPESSTLQPADTLISQGATVLWIECPPDSISSTEIRDRIRTQATIESLVPKSVHTYIEQHLLYQQLS